jgi:hypothetical protein
MSYSNNSNGDFVDKIKSVNWRGLVRQATNKVKQYAMNLSPLEIQVEEATNLDTWGPHGSVMAEISDACFDPEGYRQVLGVIARRLQEKDERWRMCYKALLLLEYLIKHGPTKVAQDVASSSSVLNKLQHFEYKDENGKDHGVNIRHRATEISDLVRNPDRLREERNKAAESKTKYGGVSAAQMRAGATGFGSTSSMPSRGSGGFDRSSLAKPGEPRSTSFRPTTSASSQHQSEGLSFGSTSSPVSTAPKVADSSGVDSIRATQARIARMNLSEAASSYDEEPSKPSKKKLSDVKANPKIAASLGLKIAPPSSSVPPAQSAQPKSNTASETLDLLADLETNTVSKSDTTDKKEETWNPFGDDTVPMATQAADPFAGLDAAPPTQQKNDFDPFSDPSLCENTVSEEPKKDPFADLLM